MGIIYLVKPNNSYLRSIDKLKPKDRKKAPECNNQNVKFGKHMGNMSSLHSRYESLVGNVNIKEIVRVDDDKIKNFEDRLKLCFSEFIRNYQEQTKTRTQEWMLGIDVITAEKIILEEYKKFNEV